MEKFKALLSIILASVLAAQACKKTASNSVPDTTATATSPGAGSGTGGSITPGSDPGVASTQGFFLDYWKDRTFVAPAAQATSKPSATGAVDVVVDPGQVVSKVSQYLFGNNLNPYNGQFITEPGLINNITALSPNILRAPGGSLSDVYFWNGNGNATQKPYDVPEKLRNYLGADSVQYYWFGNNAASFTLSLDNYYRVLQQTNSTGLITVNYGYARYGTSIHPDQTAAHLAANWVRYDRGRTRYWEIGNENYGNWEAGYRIDPALNKDGQPEILTGTVYGTHFKVFADSLRKAAAEVGNGTIKIGLVLTSTNDINNNAGIRNWNHDVLAAAGNSADFFVVHNYYTPYAQNSTADEILATPAPQTSAMMNWVKSSVAGAGVAQKPVALDEWNIQAIGSKQEVSNIAGVHAVITLGEMIKNQLSMASRWDLANDWGNGDDQGLFSTGNEPGVARWTARPAFYYLYFFQKFFGDRMVSSTSSNGNIVSYGSTFSSGQAGVILVNKSNSSYTINLTLKNYSPGSNYYYYTLNGGIDNAPFSRKVLINGVGPSNGVAGGPDDYANLAASSAIVSGGIEVTVPAYGAVFLAIDRQ